eukprot:2468593-Prymnesium_polylepis.1
MGRGWGTRASEGIGLDGNPFEEAVGRGTEGERGDAGGNAGPRPIWVGRSSDRNQGLSMSGV